jgi:methionine synthase I (cobalamin-dependent)
VGAIGLSGGDVMASKPANEKLYLMIVAQAKAKYSNYPNPGASHWVHERYIQSGGKFIETTDQTRKLEMRKKKHASDIKKKSVTVAAKKKESKKDKKKDK